MEPTIKINIFYVILSIMLAIVQVAILNTNSTSGEKLTDYLQEINHYENENTNLSQQIASSSALVVISERARQYGFTKDRTMISLDKPIPVAYSNQTP